MYTKYSYGPDGNRIGQIWLTTRPAAQGIEGRPLTSPDEDCMEPSISPDGKLVAIICPYEQQISQLTLATWSGSSLAPRSAVITDQLVPQPASPPDGSGSSYLAPRSANRPFPPWFLPQQTY